MVAQRSLDVPAVLLALLCLVAHSHAFFRMQCNQPVTYARADPITSIGKVSTHLHQVIGGDGFDFQVDFNGLRKSSCSTCQAVADKSAYWTPTLMYHAKNGSFHRVQQLGGATIYYLQRYEYPGQKLKAFPPGFRMLAGDMSLRSFNNNSLSQRAVTHHCLDYAGSGAEGEFHYLPKHNCPNGVRTQIFFPSCWDGKRLDSDDNRSHMAYPDGVDSGKCPKSHPVRLVSIFFEIFWDTNAFKNIWWDGGVGTGQPFVLSNGDPTGYAFHGDFYNGWDQGTLQKAVDSCTNLSGTMTDCHALKLRTDDEMNNCVIPPRTFDETEGWLDTLPGCNRVTMGSTKAKPATDCTAPTTIISRTNATFLTPVSNWTSVGCARDDLASRAFTTSMASKDMTVNKCVAFCSSKGFNYAGLEWGQECWCGHKFDAARLGNYVCDMSCPGNTGQRCGASGRLAVYRKGKSGSSAPAPSPHTSPNSQYIRPSAPDKSFPGPGRTGWYSVGCYKDVVSPRTLRGNMITKSNMTPNMCANHCSNMGFKYAGVEYGKECHCGNELYGSQKVASSMCNMKCSGNGGLKCGGSRALTVYRKSSTAKREDFSNHFFGRSHTSRRAFHLN